MSHPRRSVPRPNVPPLTGVAVALISGTVVSGCFSAAECNRDAVRLVLQTTDA